MPKLVRQCQNVVVMLILENMTNEHVKVASQTVMIAGTFVKTIKRRQLVLSSLKIKADKLKKAFLLF